MTVKSTFCSIYTWYWYMLCKRLYMEERCVKVAIPQFNGRVSPRFDYAPDFLILRLEDNKELDRKVISTRGLGPWRMIHLLEAEEVEAVVCGGIENFWAENLERGGIRIYPWVSGEIENVIHLLCQGKMRPNIMVYPRARCRRWRFRGGRCGWTGRW